MGIICQTIVKKIEHNYQYNKYFFHYLKAFNTASKGKYRRSSKSNVKGARKKGATLKDWFGKENWVNVSTGKKCGA